MKQILVITRITGNKEADEFRRVFFENRKEPVAADFDNLHLDIYSGFDLYDDDVDEIAGKIQSKIDADDVLMVIHYSEFEELKSELINLQNGANWEIRRYSSEDNNYGEIKKAFQQVLTDLSQVEAIDKLFSSDYVLEAKLELLHKCILPESVSSEEDLDSQLEKFSDSFKNFKKRVEEIKKNIEEEKLNGNKTEELTWNNKDYIEAFTELRISLLGS